MSKLVNLALIAGVGFIGYYSFKTYEEVCDISSTVSRESWYEAEDRMKRYTDTIVNEIHAMQEVFMDNDADDSDDEDLEPLSPDEVYKYALSRFTSIIDDEKSKEEKDEAFIKLMEMQVKSMSKLFEDYQTGIVNNTMNNLQMK